MTNRDNIHPDDSNRTSKVLWYLYWVFILLSMVLIVWTTYLKVAWNPDPDTIGFFRPDKKKNLIKPNRGAIIDHNGKLLAITTPIYDIYMDCAVQKPNYSGKSEQEIKKLKLKEDRWQQKARQLAKELPEVLSKDGKNAEYYERLILNGRERNLRYVPITKKIDHQTYK